MAKRKFIYLYALIIFAITVVLGTVPDYNWDMLPYMSIVQKMDGVSSFDQIHETTYSTAQKNLPPKKYKDLVDARDPYRKKMAEDANAFKTQLSFFDIKPVYLIIIFLFYKLGISLTYATVLPSLISFFFINLLSYFWYRKFNLSFKNLIAVLLVACAISIPLATRSNPDTLACLFLLIGSYLFLETNKLFLCVLFLILSILTRPENVIFSFLLFGIILVGKWKKKIPFYISVGYLLIMAAIYFLIMRNTDYPGWNNLFYHAFIDNTANPLIKQTITVQQYLKVIRENLLNLKGIIAIVGLIILSAFVFFFRNHSQDKNSLYVFFYVIVVFWTLIKTLLFPMTALRFIIPPILLLSVVVVKKYESLMSEKHNKAA
ncbi:MAG TPA: hypothetical protein VHB70_04740 [Parafilimonas sp.]|nr:hypothetical protein [Parafilimonas sp.]